MSNDLTIQSIHVWNFCPGFRDGPYAMSHVVQDSINGRIVLIQTNQEIHGVGEIVFQPAIAEEARQDWIRAEPEHLASLVGQDIKSIMVLAQEIQNNETSWSGVAFGLETAHLDIQGIRQRQSLTELLGGKQNDDMNDYFSISEKLKESIRKRLEIAGPARAVIQLKLGIGTRADDIEQVALTLKAMNQSQTMLADANGGWSIDEACDIVRQFDDDRIIWEEPCNTYKKNVEVARNTDKPIMFDQSVGNVDLAMQAIDDRIATAICIKPAFLGGLDLARKVRDHCAETGIKMRIDGPWCGDIATAANLHLAMGAPPDLLIASCDLREPLVLEPDLHGVLVTKPARISPPTGYGVGIRFDSELFGEPEAIYR